MSDPPSEIGIYVGKPKKKQSRTLSLPRSSACECVWAAWMRERVWASVLCVCVFVFVRVYLCVRVCFRVYALFCVCTLHQSSRKQMFI